MGSILANRRLGKSHFPCARKGHLEGSPGRVEKTRPSRETTTLLLRSVPFSAHTDTTLPQDVKLLEGALPSSFCCSMSRPGRGAPAAAATSDSPPTSKQQGRRVAGDSSLISSQGIFFAGPEEWLPLTKPAPPHAHSHPNVQRTPTNLSKYKTNTAAARCPENPRYFFSKYKPYPDSPRLFFAHRKSNMGSSET